MSVQTDKNARCSGNEYEFTDSDFNEIARFAGSKFGLHLPESKMPLVYSRLAKRLRFLGLKSFSSYREILNDPRGNDESLELLSALTTNVTHFFREVHHFETLREVVLPSLIKKARAGGRVRLWSAGCSTGMEAYSIALTILDDFPEASKMDLKILATDIDPVVVKAGRIGVYSGEDLSPLTNDQRHKYFISVVSESSKFQVADSVKSIVSFGVLNLMDDLPFSGPFDAIFCRNVAIYFTNETQQHVWQKLTSVLGETAHLFVGHSERLSGPATNMMNSVGITTYQKAEKSFTKSQEKGLS